jgi:hypothetical protein
MEIPEVIYFSDLCYDTQPRDRTLSGSSVHPPQKFTYRHDGRKYKYGVTFIGVMFTLSFRKIRQMVQKSLQETW